MSLGKLSYPSHFSGVSLTLLGKLSHPSHLSGVSLALLGKLSHPSHLSGVSLTSLVKLSHPSHFSGVSLTSLGKLSHPSHLSGVFLMLPMKRFQNLLATMYGQITFSFYYCLTGFQQKKRKTHFCFTFLLTTNETGHLTT